MKNSRLAIILAALALSAGFANAQDEEVILKLPTVSPTADALLDPAQESESDPLRPAAGRLMQTEKDLAAARRSLQVAQVKAVAPAKSFTERLVTVVHRGGGPSRALVIPRDAGDPKNMAEMTEDLTVMAHILEKAVRGGADKSARAMGIAVAPKPFGGGVPQSLFIEGYGTLFFLDVNYPLLPPPAKDDEPEATGKTSSEWEDARREITQPQPYGNAGGGAQSGYGFVGDFSPGGNVLEYDAERVDDLKKDVITALKNTAHVRKLKSDETITVVVSAPGSPVTKKAMAGNSIRVPQVENHDVLIDRFGRTSGAATGGPSTRLIFRVRKADAESFQKGNLSFDEFRKKVAQILY